MVDRARYIGIDLNSARESGKLKLEQVDAAELSPGEFTHRVVAEVHAGAQTAVIDSLNGYYAAMPEERFLRLHMHELLQYLNRRGASTFLTVAQHGFASDMKTPVDITYLADTVILLRYFEATGRIRRALSVIKKRTGAHQDDIREFEIDQHGIRVGERLAAFQGILRGIPVLAGDDAILDNRDEEVTTEDVPQFEQRALVLAPLGRDAAVAVKVLREAGIGAESCPDLGAMVREVVRGAATALIAEEAVLTADLTALAAWVAGQPPWSDFPIVLLTRQGGGVDRAASAERYTRILGNVTFLERPFHPTTLVSLVRTALRGRMRQYEARAQIEERERIAAELAAHRSRLQEMVAERTRALEEANRQLVAEAAERERTEARLHQAQKMEAVGQLIGGVAHDFNNLLAAIVGNLELIQARAPEVRIRRWASNALQAAERGAKLTGQLLAFSRMQRLELGPVDANALIEGMRSLIERSLGPGIELGLALDPTVGPAVADENQLSVLAQRYPHFFAPYRSTRSFVLGLNGIIHPEGRKLYLGAETPNFDWEEEPDGSLLMGYHSSRRMCSFAQGMVEGSAKVFGEDVRVEHVRCFHRGDPDCVLRLGFGRTPAA